MPWRTSQRFSTTSERDSLNFDRLSLDIAPPIHEIRKARTELYDVLIMLGFAIVALGMPAVLLMFWLFGT